MDDHLMVVLSNARSEMDDEFNDWYTNIHIVEVVEKLEGFNSAQRYKLAEDQVEEGASFQYLAIYRIQHDQLAAAQQAIRDQRKERAEALAAGRAPRISARKELFDGQHHSWFFSPISEQIKDVGAAPQD